MHFVRFLDSGGRPRKGRWTEAGIEFGNNYYDPESVSILPPVTPSKIIAVGKNHQSSLDKSGDDPPATPRLFFKPPHTIIGHGNTVTLPFQDSQVVYEAELGVVIGEQSRNVSRENALSIVEGYTCVNDISNLDARSISDGAVRVKGFDNAAPIGPVLATPDEVPKDALIELRLNGEVRQQAPRSELVYTIPELIEEITQYLTLEVGDIIATGTPAGIDLLHDGDRVEIEIDGIGTLEHDIAVSTE